MFIHIKMEVYVQNMYIYWSYSNNVITILDQTEITRHVFTYSYWVHFIQDMTLCIFPALKAPHHLSEINQI